MRYQTALRSAKPWILTCRNALSAHIRWWISAFSVFSGAEQGLTGFVVDQRFAPICQHLHAALHRRPAFDAVKPVFQRWVVGPVDTLVLPIAQPRVDGDVGHGVMATRDEAGLLQLAVHNAVQAARFGGIAVDGIFDFFGRVDPETVRLTEHWPDTAHLEHQPFQYGIFLSVRARQQFAGFRRQIQQDRTRLEQRDRPAVRTVRVGDGRNLVVRADLQKIRFELVTRANVNRMNALGQVAFLQHDMDLVAIGRCSRIQVDHGQTPALNGAPLRSAGPTGAVDP